MSRDVINRRMSGFTPVFAATILCMSQWLPAAEQVSSPDTGGLQSRYIDVQGVQTRFYDQGKGDIVLLLHGSGFTGTASSNTWSRNIAGLSERFRVLAPDKLASGMTGNPVSDDDLNIRGEIQHLRNFIETLDLGATHIVGQSRGGGLAFLFAMQYPELVRTLSIIDSATASPPAGDDRPTRRNRLFAECPSEETPQADQFRCQQSALYYDPAPVSDEFVAAAAYMWRQPKSQETARRMTPDLRGRNSELTSELVHKAYHRILTEEVLQMPVLLYWSKNDPSVLPQQGYALYNIIAETNARAWLLFTNRGGHFHYREHPEEFNRNLTHFLNAWDD